MNKPWGIKQNVLVLALTPAITIAIFLSVYFTSLRLNELNNSLIEHSTAIASKLAAQAEYSLFTNELETLRKLGRKELNDEVSSVSFYNTTGIEIANVGKVSTKKLSLPFENVNLVQIHDDPEHNTLAFSLAITMPEIASNEGNTSATISLDEENVKPFIIGWVKIDVEHKAIKLKEYQILLNSSAITLLCLIIIGFVAYRLGAKVTKPILAITKAVKDIRQGKLNTKIKTNAKWELAILKSGINSMASSLQKAHEGLRRNIEQATSELRHSLQTIEQQNKELNLAKQEAEDVSNLKSEFLANMNHELRTPLNGIIGFINLLQKTDLSKVQKDYLNTMQKSANSLLSIINDILDFSTLEAGKLYLDIAPMSIMECIEDTLTLLAPKAHEKNIELISFVSKKVPALINADFLRIKQIITNLINNAIKFTYEGTVIIKVMLKEQTNAEVTLLISVQDTGIGLSKAQKGKLFSAFNQLSPKLSQKFGGTGLGLVICKKLVEQMHGKIDLESYPRKGSTFWFTIKVEKSLEQPKIDSTDSFSKTNILLCEPHPTAREAIKNLLSTWGFIVHEISSTDEIEKTIKYASISGNPFQLTLLGVNQVDNDNKLASTLATIKQQYSCPMGIIINSTDHVIHDNLLQQGFVFSLAKPICSQKLYTCLFELFSNKPLTNYKTINKELPLLATKILVVDDNFENLKLATALLGTMNIAVTTANSSAAALQAIKHDTFDMILMDFRMPDMDGIKTSQAIRKSNTSNKDTPIVVLSANIHYREKTAITKSQINDYLIKPINEAQLLTVIQKWTHSPTYNNAETTAPQTYTSPEPATELNLTKSIDWELAVKLAAGNLVMARDMLEMLISTLPKEQASLNEKYTAGDKKSLIEIAHKLHGGCCYTGTPKLKQVLKQLEITLETKELKDVADLMSDLNVEIDNLIALWLQEKEVIATTVLESIS